MNPAIIMKMIESAKGLTAAGIESIPTQYERYNKKQLESLQRNKEFGLLGLSDAEKQQLYGRYEDQIGAQQKGIEAKRKQYLANTVGGAVSGAAFEQAAVADEAAAMARQRAMSDVTAQDIIAKKEQEQEIEDRMSVRGAEQAQRRATWAGAIRGAGEAAVEGYGQKVTLEGQSGQKQANAFSQEYGISSGEASELGGYLSDNPELMNLLLSSFGG